MVSMPYTLDHSTTAVLRDALLDQDDLADTEVLLARVIEQPDLIINHGVGWQAPMLRMDVDHSHDELAML